MRLFWKTSLTRISRALRSPDAENDIRRTAAESQRNQYQHEHSFDARHGSGFSYVDGRSCGYFAMFGGLNLRDQIPLPVASEDDVSLVVNRSRRVIESRRLKCPVIGIRRVGDDANTSILDCGSHLRVEDGYAEMHRADFGPVRLYRDDDFVRSGGAAVKLQRLIEDIGATAWRLSHDDYAEQSKRGYSKEQPELRLRGVRVREVWSDRRKAQLRELIEENAGVSGGLARDRTWDQSVMSRPLCR